ncbi:hypothetical protein J6590_046053 [Homalodisca vitripennis]|nr:hypothetical protein J6590_046053 [Homalodisca vitripennis]
MFKSHLACEENKDGEKNEKNTSGNPLQNVKAACLFLPAKDAVLTFVKALGHHYRISGRTIRVSGGHLKGMKGEVEGRAILLRAPLPGNGVNPILREIIPVRKDFIHK